MNEYPPWFITMLEELCDMRDAQKEYFSQPNEYRLKLANLREQKVDNSIEHFVKQGLVAHKTKPKETQPSLFNS